MTLPVEKGSAVAADPVRTGLGAVYGAGAGLGVRSVVKTWAGGCLLCGLQGCIYVSVGGSNRQRQV